MGVLVSKCHLATAWFWFSIAILQTTISHSGYHFPLLPSPEAHDFHHLKFNQNFGKNRDRMRHTEQQTGSLGPLIDSDVEAEAEAGSGSAGSGYFLWKRKRKR